MLKRIVKKIIRTGLEPFGLTICRTEGHIDPWDHHLLLEKYKTLITETEECLSDYVFPGLSPCTGRIELMGKLIGTPIGEAFYIINHLQKSLTHDGDVCEFGVAQGATSALLANEIRSTEKRLWLFDSFKGLSKPGQEDVLINDIFNLGSIDKYEGRMASKVDEVETRLRVISFPFSRVKIVAGFIEETIKYAELPQKVCFAYIDFDFYSPISVALKFLDERLVVGGSIVVDDYGFFSSGAKTAVDEFLKDHGHKYTTVLPSRFANDSTPFVILSKCV